MLFLLVLICFIYLFIYLFIYVFIYLLIMIHNKEHHIYIRLRVVPHFSSGIVERAKRERA